MIAVGGAKGGVGKSTVACNLAVALGASGASVGLIDAEAYVPALSSLMGLTERARINEHERILPVTSHGVRVASLSHFLLWDDVPVLKGAVYLGLVRDLFELVEWGELDYLIVDLPPGLGELQFTLCRVVPSTGVVLVTTPSPLAVDMAVQVATVLGRLGVQVLGFVENLSGSGPPATDPGPFGAGDLAGAAAKVGHAFLGRIPLDRGIGDRSGRGPAALEGPGSPLAAPFFELARRVVEIVDSGA